MDLYLAYGLILLGLLLFAAELFLPTGGVLFVLGGGWLLDRTFSEGVAKTVVWWLLVGLAVTLFGGVSRIAGRRDGTAPPE